MKIKPKDVGQGFLTAIIVAAVIAGVALMVDIILNTDEIIKDEATLEVELVTEDYYYEVEMNVSAYCPCEECCGEFADGITASGVAAKGRLIAASSNYAFGTRMDVPGYGTARVQDRGGAITGNKIDLLFTDIGKLGEKGYISGHQRALNWGRKILLVKIYK